MNVCVHANLFGAFYCNGTDEGHLIPPGTWHFTNHLLNYLLT